MNLLLVILLIAAIAEISAIVQDAVMDYFESGIVQNVNKIWQGHQIAYENSLSLAMQESYGHKGMNIYIKRPPYPMRVAKGYYHTDNQVHLFLDDLKLEDLPHLEDPRISLPLLSNVLLIDGMVSKMNIHANYIVLRNTSFIVYDRTEQDPYKTSPFLFEQVQNTGQLAITVEGCKIGGMGIVALTGATVSLGNTIFKLRNCQFNMEIFTPGFSSPPVVANYLLKSEGGVGLTLQDVLIKPLTAELIPKLQAALHSYINTSAIFTTHVGLAQLAQQAVFEKTTNYVNNIIRNLNALTINRNMGKIKMDDLTIAYNDTVEEGAANSMLKLSNLQMTGTETLYSAHTGGPYKTDLIKIYEELRFGTIQVTGSMTLQVSDKTEGMYDFAVEINDVETDITFHVNRRSRDVTKPSTTPMCITVNKNIQQTQKPILRMSPDEYSIEVTGWRSLAFSSPNNKFVLSEAVVTGHLVHVVPYYLKRHLESILVDAVIETDEEYQQLKHTANDDKNKQALLAEIDNVGPDVGDGEGKPVDQPIVIVDPNELHEQPEVIPESEVDFDHPIIHTEPPAIAEPEPIPEYANIEQADNLGDVAQPKFFDDNKFSELTNDKYQGSMADGAVERRRQLRKGRNKLRQRKNVKSLMHRRRPYKLQNPIK